MSRWWLGEGTTTVRDCNRDGHIFGHWTTGGGYSCRSCGIALQLAMRCASTIAAPGYYIGQRDAYREEIKWLDSMKR